VHGEHPHFPHHALCLQGIGGDRHPCAQREPRQHIANARGRSDVIDGDVIDGVLRHRRPRRVSRILHDRDAAGLFHR
jgi:hypothetical protein